MKESMIVDTITSIHGSGINGKWHIETKQDRVILSNSFDVMDAYGWYRQTVPFTLSIPIENPIAFKLVFHTSYRYWINKIGLEEYLEDTFSIALEGVEYERD